MACCRNFCLISLALGAAFLGYCSYFLLQVPPIPQLATDQWWGPNEAPKTLDTSIRPFKIEFNPQRLESLKTRLADVDWFTEPLENIGFQYGFNSKFLKNVASFWRTKYDFAERQKYLNKHPHFKTNIQGMNIHFIHIKQADAKNKRVIPLLMLHGWPGSFVEFYKMIPLLTAPAPDRDFVFNLIIPSLPGYGYSQGASKSGLSASHMAVVMNNLMARLGYKKYVAHGGDWGAMITSSMSILYPENIYGYHSNMPFASNGVSILKQFLGSLYPAMVDDPKHASKMYPLSTYFQFLLEETGYMHLQSTKPDTVGIALGDSPIGLAAYILEKFSTWTNKEWKSLPDGGLTKKYTLTELLDNIMIYWDSRSITTSMRLYSETFNKAHKDLKMDSIPITVPTALARFPNELAFSSKCQLKGKYVNMVQLSDFEDGGHFAAFEMPKLMANDIISAVSKFDSYYKESNKVEL